MVKLIIGGFCLLIIVLQILFRILLRFHTFSLIQSEHVSVKNTTVFSIPDNNPSGVQSSIFINDSFSIKGVEVEILLDHSYLGDLEIVLINPITTKLFY